MASPTIQVKRGLFANLPALRAGEPGFTTDKYDLYLGIGAGTTASNQFYGSSRYWTRENGSNAAEFKFVDKDGTNGVSLRSPAEVTTPVTYTLPQGGSPEGYYLRLGTSGVLEWSSVSDGATFENATFTGITTFSGIIDANAGLDVAGGSTFDNINVTGIATVGTTLDVNGLADLTNVNVSVAATIASADINGGTIDATVIGGSSPAAGTFTHLVYDSSSTTGISTVGSLYVGSTKVLSTEGGLVTLSGIQTVDATTIATLENLLSLDPNDFSTLNVAGISTIGGLLDANGGLDVFGHTELDNLNVSGVATFAQSIDASILGNAGTATSLSTARNFEISGDVVATAVSFDGTGNVNLVAEIQANSVGLGTDTFGDYVAGVTGTANQISVSGSGGETAAVVLSLPDDVVVGTSLSAPTIKTATVQHSNGTEAITIDAGGNVGVSTNLTVTGDLIINGNTTQVSTTQLTVEDTLVELGFVNGAAPTGDFNKDLGLLLNYFSGTAKKAAVYWDESDAKLVFASEVTESSGELSVVGTSYATILAGGLEINNGCTEGATTVISCVGNELSLSNIVVDGGSF
jgi:hypothetical protein